MQVSKLILRSHIVTETLLESADTGNTAKSNDLKITSCSIYGNSRLNVVCPIT